MVLPMRRRWDVIFSIVCIVILVGILLYACVTIYVLNMRKDNLIYNYETLMQVYQNEIQKEPTTLSTKKLEEDALNLWNACSNVDAITWKQAEELDIRDEYIQNRVAKLVNGLAYSMAGSTRYADKREAINLFLDDIDALQVEIGRRHMAFEDAKAYGKYLNKIFR